MIQPLFRASALLALGVLAAGSATAQVRPAAVAPAPSVATPAPGPAAPANLSRAQFLVEMDTEFRKMDADKNGQVTRNEAAAFLRANDVAEAEARNRAAFMQLDTDRNGQISPVEFRRAMTPPPQRNGQRFISGSDLNKDSQVSLVEHRTTTLANFDRLDADKDGIVTAAEMRAGGLQPR